MKLILCHTALWSAFFQSSCSFPHKPIGEILPMCKPEKDELTCHLDTSKVCQSRKELSSITNEVCQAALSEAQLDLASCSSEKWCEPALSAIVAYSTSQKEKGVNSGDKGSEPVPETETPPNPNDQKTLLATCKKINMHSSEVCQEPYTPKDLRENSQCMTEANKSKESSYVACVRQKDLGLKSACYALVAEKKGKAITAESDCEISWWNKNAIAEAQKYQKDLANKLADNEKMIQQLTQDLATAKKGTEDAQKSLSEAQDKVNKLSASQETKDKEYADALKKQMDELKNAQAASAEAQQEAAAAQAALQAALNNGQADITQLKIELDASNKKLNEANQKLKDASNQVAATTNQDPKSFVPNPPVSKDDNGSITTGCYVVVLSSVAKVRAACKSEATIYNGQLKIGEKFKFNSSEVRCGPSCYEIVYQNSPACIYKIDSNMKDITKLEGDLCP